MTAQIKRWLINVEDENGEVHYLIEDNFIGTYPEASIFAAMLADQWEQKTGGLVLKIELESRGPFQPIVHVRTQLNDPSRGE
mgnify:FL=1